MLWLCCGLWLWLCCAVDNSRVSVPAASPCPNVMLLPQEKLASTKQGHAAELSKRTAEIAKIRKGCQLLTKQVNEAKPLSALNLTLPSMSAYHNRRVCDIPKTLQ